MAERHLRPVTATSDILRRVPPHSLDAEESTLGAVLLDNDAIDVVLEVLEGDDFYREAHRLIFDAMLTLRLRGDPIDAITLTEEIRVTGVIEQVGGPAYLAELAMRVPTAANAAYYARIVREKAALRRLAATATAIAAEAYDAKGNAAELFAAADRQFGEVINSRELRIEPDFPALVAQAAATLDKPDQANIPSGFAEYDTRFGGLHQGELMIVAALSSRGKTTFAMNVAVQVARFGVGVLFVSVEMAGRWLAARYIHAHASIDAVELRSRGLYETEFQRVDRAVSEAQKLTLSIRYRPGCRPREVLRLARAYQREHQGNLGLVVVDYLQLMKPDRRCETKEQDLDDIASSLKLIAGELDLCVLAPAQINREIHHRDEPTPRLSDLRGSGAIEQHADTVAFIWAATTKNRPAGSDELTNFTVAKSRNGPTGSFQLIHRPRYLRFEDAKNVEQK